MVTNLEDQELVDCFQCFGVVGLYLDSGSARRLLKDVTDRFGLLLNHGNAGRFRWQGVPPAARSSRKSASSDNVNPIRRALWSAPDLVFRESRVDCPPSVRMAFGSKPSFSE